MQLGRFDAMLDFGKVTLSSGTIDFPNVIQLGKSGAQRMSVAVTNSVKATGGTSVVVKLLGSNDNASYKELAQSTSVALADLEKGVSIGIPNGYNSEYLKLQVVCTGTFTGGELIAGIDTYTGV